MVSPVPIILTGWFHRIITHRLTASPAHRLRLPGPRTPPAQPTHQPTGSTIQCHYVTHTTLSGIGHRWSVSPLQPAAEPLESTHHWLLGLQLTLCQSRRFWNTTIAPPVCKSMLRTPKLVHVRITHHLRHTLLRTSKSFRAETSRVPLSIILKASSTFSVVSCL